MKWLNSVVRGASAAWKWAKDNPAARAVARAVVRWALEREFQRLKDRVRREAAENGAKGIDLAMDGLQGLALRVLNSRAVRFILPDAWEDKLKTAVQAEGDKLQEKLKNEFETQGLAGLDPLLEAAKAAILARLDSGTPSA